MEPILFLNKNQAVVEEFRSRIGFDKFQVDTANTCERVVEMLGKKEYKILVTGIVMKPEDSMDGMGLLQYVREKYPHISCMVYTAKMDVNKLTTLMNQLDVYRVFRRPIKDYQILLAAIEDGIIYSDGIREKMKVKQKRDDIEKRKSEDDKKRELFLRYKEEAYYKILRYMNVSVETSVSFSEGRLSEEQQQYTKLFENALLEAYLEDKEVHVKGYEDIEPALHKEFVATGKMDGFKIYLEGKNMGREERALAAKVHNLLWILCFRFSGMTKHYKMVVHITGDGERGAYVSASFAFTEQTWKSHNEHEASLHLTKLMEEMVSGLGGGLRRVEKNAIVTYRMEIYPKE